MNDTGTNPYGWRGYFEASSQIAAREKRSFSCTLVRMLAARAAYGLSATEYALFRLYERRFSELADYRNKEETTALFNRVNSAAKKFTVEDKLEFHRRCMAAALPVPRLHAILSRRSATQIHDFPVFPNLVTMLESMAGSAPASFIMKPRRDALGTGLRFLRWQQGEIFDISGRLVDLPQFAADLDADMARDDYLVQEFLSSHQVVGRLGSGRALGTLRIVTWLHDGALQFLYALLRIPCGDTCKDNFVSGSTGNLISKVDLTTGRIGSAWGRRDHRYSRLLEAFEHNPDNGQPIAGVSVPYWPLVRDTLQRAAPVFTGLHALGWDVAVTDSGVVLIEANSNPDIIGEQICADAGAGILLDRLSA